MMYTYRERHRAVTFSAANQFHEHYVYKTYFRQLKIVWLRSKKRLIMERVVTDFRSERLALG